MLVGTYDPDGEASCPTCKKVVPIKVLGGFMMGHDPYVHLYHADCETEWKRYYGRGEDEIIKEGVA